MLLDFSATFFGNVRGLFPIYARDILSVGPTGLGVLYSSRAIGSLFAAGALTMFGPVRHSGRWIFLGIGIYGLSTVLFAGSQVFWFSILMLILTGAGDTISSILRSTINQLSTPDELRGRMSSINSIFTSSGPQLGQFESGVVAAWLGAQLSALTGGIATLLALIAIGVSFPKVRRFQIPRFSDN
jgi:MFS family permease